METNGNFDTTREPDLLTFYLETLSMYAQSLVRRTVRTVNRGIEGFRIAELFDAINEKIAEHPPLRFLVIASPLCCALPLTMFIIFGVISAIVLFAGFLLIEGTLLALGGLCMFLCILSLMLLFSAFAMIFGAFYVLALRMGCILNGLEETSNEMQRSIPPAISDRKGTWLFQSVCIFKILLFRFITSFCCFIESVYYLWKIIYIYFYLSIRNAFNLNI